MKNILSAAQVHSIIHERERLEDYLYAAGISPRQVQGATLYLRSDLTALLLLGIQVIEVDHAYFLSLLEGRSK